MQKVGTVRRGARAARARKGGGPSVARLRVLLPLLTAACLVALLLLSYGRADVGLVAMGMPVLAQLPEAQTAPGEAEPAGTPQPLRLSVLGGASVPTLQTQTGDESAPTILIYHTHTTEAYAQTETYTYTPSGSWRTTDNEKNVVAVGELLAEQLRAHGFGVLHNTTDHEPPQLASAYSRSEETMRAYQEKYPSLRVFIDVHRDAYGNADTPITDYLELDGKEVARMMFVVGTGEGATGTGFDQMPDFERNYALAEAVTAYLTAVDSRLARPIRVKTGRYNQHISDQCLLVEIGHNCNSLDQALAAVPYLAEALAAALEAGDPAAALGEAGTAVWAPAA